MKKRVAIIGTAYPFRGGLAAFNERLALELQTNQEVEVKIFTFTLQYPSFLFPGSSQYSQSGIKPLVTIKRLINSINPLNWFYCVYVISKYNPNLLIVKFWLPFMGPCFGTILRGVCWLRKIPSICIVDNMIPHEKRVGDRPFTKYFVGSVDHFITMSSKVYKDTLTFTKKKQTVEALFHPLYDHFGEGLSKKQAREKLQLPLEDKLILFFGVIRDYKGLDILLDALIITDQSVKLIIAGEFYGNKQQYLDQINQNSIKNRVFLFDLFIPDDQVRYFFESSDIVVQPYKNATQSGVTQICYHFNKPMIVTNVGGLPEMVPDGKVGYVVEPNSQAVARAIDLFYQSNAEAEMVKQVILEKNKYSWKYFSDRILSYI